MNVIKIVIIVEIHEKEKSMNISIIVAFANNRVIGLNNQLPWNLPSDLKHFKEITMGKPVIMGRKTYESIGRPLPGRKNIVLTRIKHFDIAGCTVVHSLEEALIVAEDGEEVFVIGGETVYREALPLADKMVITHIHADFEGDAFFPEWDLAQWQEVSREDHEPDEKNKYPYSFVVYQRLQAVSATTF